MSEETNSRLDRIEGEISQLTQALQALREADTKLTLAVALLEQTMKSIKEHDDKKDAFSQKIALFFVAALIGGFMTFVLKGGLTL